MRFEFEGFVLDTTRRELTRKGETLHLSPKGLQLLTVLISERPRAVPKQELQEKIWGDVIVEEANLTNLVSELRALLGDDARHPRYIRTMHGFGYTFIAEVRTAAESTSDPAFSHRRSATLLAAVVVLVVAAIAVFTTRNVSSTSDEGSVSRSTMLVEPIHTAESVAWIAASPDGRFMAYSTQATARKTIRLLHLESGSEVELLPMEEVPRLQRLRFSPDGDFIYYLVSPFADSGNYEIRRVSVLGGPSTLVIRPREGFRIQGFDLSPNGDRIAYGLAEEATDAARIVIANLEGEIVRQFEETSPARMLCCTISWSPDGTTLVAFIDDWTGSASGAKEFNLMAIEVESGETRLFAPRSDARLFSMSWLPNDRALIATTEEGDLVYVEYPSGRIKRLPQPSDWKHLWVFPSGDRFVSMTRRIDVSLWTVDLLTGGSHRISHVGQKGDGAQGLAWSPDGTIVFTSGKDERTRSLWSCDATGAHRKQLTQPADGVRHWYPAISPDGRWIVFMETLSLDTGGSDSRLVRIASDGTGWTYLTPPGHNGGRPAFTPDGKTIIYTRRALEGEPRAMRISIEGGEPEELPFTRECATGGVDASGSAVVCCDRLSREYVLRFDGELIWEGDIPANPPIHFTRENLMSYPERGREGIGNVWTASLDGTPPRQLTNFTSDRVFNHAWHPAESQIVVSRGGLRYEPVLVSGLPPF